MKLASPTPAADPAPALSRGLAVLRALATDGPQTLEQLARASGWPKSSLLRLLRSLAAFGAVRRDAATKRYHALLTLAPLGDRGPGLLEQAAPVLDALCAEAGQTTELYAWGDGALTMIDRREPEEALVSVRARIGFQRNLAEVEALSQVVHAFDESTALPGKPWAWRGGKRTTLSITATRKAVAEAKRRGVGIDLGVNEFGIRRYAAPLLSGDRLVGVLAIAQFCTPRDTNASSDLRDALREAAQRLSNTLSTAPVLRAGYPRKPRNPRKITPGL